MFIHVITKLQSSILKIIIKTHFKLSFPQSLDRFPGENSHSNCSKTFSSKDEATLLTMIINQVTAP